MPLPSLPPGSLQDRLLAWYDRERRALPWRALPGERPDPYRVWVSEIMLQQTTAAAVAPYFTRFMGLWPRVEDLAAADLDAVLHAWQGLGYYARARNMHACSRAVAASGGRFPEREDELRQLPGIGAYTAAAIAAIAFDRPAVPVDGNVVRVLARLHALDEPLPAARPAIEVKARALAPAARAGDFAQALMDLGATVCTPRQPPLSRLPVAGGLRRFCWWRTGDLSPEGREEGPAGASRRRLLGPPQRRRGPSAPAAGEGAARRDDGGSLNGMAGTAVDRA